MTYHSTLGVPAEARAVCLYKHVGDELRACETVGFLEGAAAIDTTLRRAAISGRVEVGGQTVDHFADLLDANGSIIETVALDARSYKALKTRWMRCKLEPV